MKWSSSEGSGAVFIRLTKIWELFSNSSSPSSSGDFPDVKLFKNDSEPIMDNVGSLLSSAFSGNIEVPISSISSSVGPAQRSQTNPRENALLTNQRSSPLRHCSLASCVFLPVQTTSVASHGNNTSCLNSPPSYPVCTKSMARAIANNRDSSCQ